MSASSHSPNPPSSISLSKAFGRSLPTEMRESRERLLQSTGQQSLLEKPRQLWKVNDEKAGKNGNCQAVYWVKEKDVKNDLKRRTSASTKLNDKHWELGSVYKGEWLANKKHGYGIQIYANGNKYEGEWAEGMREGHGVFWLNKKEKKGTASGGKEQEEEKTNGSSGSSSRPSTTPSINLSSSTTSKSTTSSQSSKLRRVYAGNWKSDLKSGMGVYFYTDGSRYEGSWKEDVRSGRGTLYYTNNDIYTGEWLNNYQNGFGTLTKANEDVYEGEWINGMREGAGIYYYKEKGKIYDGEWVNDQPKCGVYLDAKEFFGDDSATGGAASSAATSSSSDRPLRNRVLPIPRLRLSDADGVLAKSIELIAYERAAVRSLPTIQLSELYDEKVIDTFRELFMRFDADAKTGDESGLIHIKHLPAMLKELGLAGDAAGGDSHSEENEFTRQQLHEISIDLRKGQQMNSKLSFPEFVRAIHLREEARNIQQQTKEQEELQRKQQGFEE